jgi:hypothetical protein
MAQSKILLDTSAYLHLAVPFHPLIGEERGLFKYTFYLTDKHENEFRESNLLSINPKFFWFKEEKYIVNRKRILTLSKQQVKEADLLFKEIVKALPYLGLEELSPYDIWYLVYAKVLKTKFVTDDSKLRDLADAQDVTNFDTLELLKHLLKEVVISPNEIKAAKKYWTDVQNFPLGKSFSAKYNRLFKKI